MCLIECWNLRRIPNKRLPITITKSEIVYSMVSHVESTWWRHQMETFTALLAICAGNSQVTCEFPAQSPVTQSFDVFFDLRQNKRLSKKSWGWWFETLSGPLWRHCNDRVHRILNSNTCRHLCVHWICLCKHALLYRTVSQMHKYMHTTKLTYMYVYINMVMHMYRSSRRNNILTNKANLRDLKAATGL